MRDKNIAHAVKIWWCQKSIPTQKETQANMITTHQFLANCLNGAIAPSTPLLISKLAKASREKKRHKYENDRYIFFKIYHNCQGLINNEMGMVEILSSSVKS